MKIIKKVLIMLSIFLIILILINSNQSYSYDMLTEIKSQASASVTGGAVDAVSNVAGAAITVTRVICAAVAVAMLSILGIKYMTAAPGEKADIKKHAVVYIVGAVVMFACTGILVIIENFAGSLGG